MGWARRLGVAAALVGALATVVVAWLRTQLWEPNDVRPAPVVCAAEAPSLPRGQTVKVLVWNVQFAGSRQYEFFYDGGKQVHVPEADVLATLDAIAAVIREQDPDIVLLQEIDRGSDRTARIDEHAELLSRLAYPCSTSTPYHQVAYVPHPAFEHMGRVNMHLSVFSRYRIDAATRTQLPLLVEPWWRQVFNIRRALLDVDLPLAGGGRFHVFNTHLSAFSNGDGTLERQVAVLDSVLTRTALAGDAFVIGGDLNSLPPGDDATRLCVPDHRGHRRVDRYRCGTRAVRAAGEARNAKERDTVRYQRRGTDRRPSRYVGGWSGHGVWILMEKEESLQPRRVTRGWAAVGDAEGM